MVFPAEALLSSLSLPAAPLRACLVTGICAPAEVFRLVSKHEAPSAYRGHVPDPESPVALLVHLASSLGSGHMRSFPLLWGLSGPADLQAPLDQSL